MTNSGFDFEPGLEFKHSTIAFDGTTHTFPTLIADHSQPKSVTWGGRVGQDCALIDSCLWVHSGNVASAGPTPSATKMQTNYDLLQFQIGCEFGKKHCNLKVEIYWGQCSGLLEEDLNFQRVEHGLAELAKFAIVNYDMVGEVMTRPSGQSEQYSKWLDAIDFETPSLVDEKISGFETFLNSA